MKSFVAAFAAIAVVVLAIQPKPLWGGSGKWERIGLEGQLIADVAVCIDCADTILVGVRGSDETGAYRTEDGGESWVVIDDTIGARDCLRLSGHPDNSNVFLFIPEYSNRIYKSTDYGGKWREGQVGPSFNLLACAEFDPSSPSIVYAGGTMGLYRSTNGGQDFSVIDIGVGDKVASVAVDPSDSGILYVGTAANGLYKSTNDGVDWIKKTNGFRDHNSNVTFIRIDTLATGTVYASYLSDGYWSGDALYRSTNGGDSWNPLEPEQPITDFYLHQEIPTMLALATEEHGALYSVDGGGVFLEFIDGFGTPLPWIYGIEADRQNPDILFAATEDGLWRLEIDIKPARPENPEAVLAADGILVSWDPVTLNEDGSPCDDLYGYVLRRNNLPGPATVIVDTLEYTGDDPALLDRAEEDPVLEMGHAYRYQVQAIDLSMNAGAWSDWSNALLWNPVGIGCRLGGTPVDGGIELRWKIEVPCDFIDCRMYRRRTDQGEFSLLASIPVGDGIYHDASVCRGKRYLYRLGLVKASGGEEFSNTVALSPLPRSISQASLGPILPNPFNPRTDIPFDVPEGGGGAVSLRIFNSLGELVDTLVEGRLNPGHYSVSWEGRDGRGNDVASGLYYCVLTCDDRHRSGKLLLLK